MNIGAVTRPLNTIYQISGGHNAFFTYAIDIACQITLSGGQVGTVYVETADDDTFSTNIEEVCRTVNGNSGTVVVGISMTQNCTAQLSGMISAGKYVRIRTQNNTGSPTFTWRSGQETQF